MTDCPNVSRKARRLAASYLSSSASLSLGRRGSESARVLLLLIESGRRDAELESLLGADGDSGWAELATAVLSASSTGYRLLLCEAAIAAAKKSVMATDWLRKIEKIGEVRAEHGETTAYLAKRLRPLLESAAEEVLEVYSP